MEMKISSGILVFPGRGKYDMGRLDWGAIREETIAGKVSAGPGPWYPKVGIKIQGRESLPDVHPHTSACSLGPLTKSSY